MNLDNIKIVKNNLSSFWQNCFSTNANFQICDKDNIFHTVSDIDDPLMNAVLSSNLKANEIESMVNDIQSYYDSKNLSFCWWVDSSTDDPNLVKQLGKNKFTLFGNVSGMVKNIGSTLATQPSSHDIEIIELTNSHDLREWLTPIKVGFAMSDISAEKYLNIFEKLSVTSNPPAHFLAKYQDKVIASSTLFFGENAGIYNCATLPEHRGKGALSLLTTKMLEKAKERGYKQVTLQASPMSISVFRKHGFQDVVPYKVYLMKR